MELWGSSYLLHETQPVRLIGTIGSSTGEAGPGTIRLSFHQEPEIFAVTSDGAGSHLVTKWDLALGLMALVHVLVLQNRLLRGEKAELGDASKRERIFTVAGGGRASPIVCSWDPAAKDLECHAVGEGGSDQFELVLTEEAATELVTALAERIATNGIAAQRGLDTK